MGTNLNTGRGSDKFLLRLPDGMRDKISEAAKENRRTMNSEVVARLASSFERLKSHTSPTGAQGPSELLAQLKQAEADLAEAQGVVSHAQERHQQATTTIEALRKAIGAQEGLLKMLRHYLRQVAIQPEGDALAAALDVLDGLGIESEGGPNE